ncbi:flagellar basal-body MS-ring/collar protein FliF [Pseudooceanicola nanhaiensis]|uniref:flagellar basal-body MS-ring/collar protein FliF n=1 Tax=Pseudooceanicola nanhaiensis TaxID=375761 RepID=UPI001CD3036F|nr:flagellar basal-body MS-ring/collar protein FliF [Pseudooceanicola nanhaiensis]MCA0922635.1 flagellar M-ring protein FliF [Pseudooceanicola nanhaiensis]
MGPFIDNLLSLGRGRLIALGATGVGIVFALLFGLNMVMRPEYVPLYSNLSPAAASRLIDALEGAGFKVELEAAGSTVSVPREDIPRARMALAEQGLLDEGTPGWEIFDQSSGLGMNTFMQRVNRLRAMEGELARSIQTIDGIAAARVHLVLPEREAFSRETAEPSASVIVRGAGSAEIGRREGQSIRALVASAVPGLAPGRVTVLSASGETILAEDGDSTAEVTLQSVRTAIEERMSRNIQSILTARVGAGNARVNVNVDLTTERQVIRQQSYDPSQRVVRSTETREENTEDTRNAQGEVGVLDNLPGGLQNGPGGQPQNSNSSASTNEIVNYEIGNTSSEVVREPGDINRISVAVLVNGIYNVADDGTVAYEERSADELERLTQLVQSAVGFDNARGDTVQVDSLRFMDYSMDVGEPVGQSIGQVLTDNLMSILRGLFALGVVAAVMAFGVMPLLRRMTSEGGDMPALAGAAAGGGALALAGGEAGALADPAALPAAQRPNAPALSGPAPTAGGGAHTGTILGPDDMDGEVVQLGPVSGGIKKGWIESVGVLVENEPDESLRVIQSWLAEEL